MSDDRAARPLDAAPWEEPRGPHLPDFVQRVPALAWVFVAISAGRLWMLVDTARLGPAPDPTLIGGTITNAVSSLAILLLPAALLIRHPDALQRTPILVFGVITIAIAEVLEALGPGLQPVFESTNAESDLVLTSTISLAYSAAALLIALVGLVGIGVGLRRARRSPGRGGWGLNVPILVLGGIVVVTRLAATWRFLPNATDSIASSIYFWIAVPGGIAAVLAWVYLTVVTLQGVRAGEEPATGWGLGILAGLLAILAYLLLDAMLLLAAPVEDVDVTLFLASIVFAAGPASLLVAFAAGLPSLEPPREMAGD